MCMRWCRGWFCHRIRSFSWITCCSLHHCAQSLDPFRCGSRSDIATQSSNSAPWLRTRSWWWWRFPWVWTLFQWWFGFGWRGHLSIYNNFTFLHLKLDSRFRVPISWQCCGWWRLETDISGSIRLTFEVLEYLFSLHTHTLCLSCEIFSAVSFYWWSLTRGWQIMLFLLYKKTKIWIF